jgi:hypothetical protein
MVENKKVYMVYRSATARMAETIAQIFPNARIGLLYHKTTFIETSLNLPKIVADFESVGLEAVKQTYGETA